MKRILTMLLALLLVNSLVTVSYGEEDFKIHGGLTFGMSKEEVIQYEENLYGNDGKVEYDSDDYYGIGEIMIETQFAGLPSRLYFSFLKINSFL